MNFYWIFLLVFREVLCGEVCTYQVGASQFTTICSGNKYCCESNTSCCSKLSTGAIIAFAVGGAVFLALIVTLIIYVIVKHNKKKSNITPVLSAGVSERDQPPPYTPRVLVNHPLQEAPPSYDYASGSSHRPTGHAPTQQSERKVPL